MIYFDFAATTPLDKDAAEVYLQAATEFFGNSSSLHDIGGSASALLENCREELAGLANVNKNGLFFTSGGSESNFLAIEALLSAPKKQGNHIISGMAEHSSIHSALNRFKGLGYEITFLPLNSFGLINIEDLMEAIRPETILITIQHVNSEIGAIQPIEKIAQICLENNIHFHSDFVQSFGKMNLSKVAPLVSSFSFSGHKIYGPKGVGGVYLDPSISWRPFFPGGSHEKGFRPGTVNVPGIAAMTAAAQKIFHSVSGDFNHYVKLRKAFLETLGTIEQSVQVFEAKENDAQLPSIVGLRVAGIEGQWMMLESNRKGFAISTGSACQVGMQTPSKIMKAMGVKDEQAKEFIRISFGRSTTDNDVLRLGDALVGIVKEYKGTSVI
ncbi:cysteine desulfurase [Bacillus sp. MUM 116]|uniref:IscS subfamily cysteine desulfurase n=1 Tax=Bacillus sp. MUM 116 TaxID=1678002 RepID=UPI0008F5B466|nr:IscS subfamily cysteine desulfurase [Bacillus sp. MUM 116]OIK16988.1 cysteine desulfurase [Bacillus sp. MUM 116]